MEPPEIYYCEHLETGEQYWTPDRKLYLQIDPSSKYYSMRLQQSTVPGAYVGLDSKSRLFHFFSPELCYTADVWFQFEPIYGENLTTELPVGVTLNELLEQEA